MTDYFSEYREKMRELAVSLLAMSNHLDNVAKFANDCADACTEVAECIDEYVEHIKDN